GRVVSVLGYVLEHGNPQVDLGHLETGDLDVEVETEQGEILELLRQQPVVPDRDLGEAVVGDPEGAGLRRCQVIEAQRRHLAPAQLPAGAEPTVPGDYVVVGIDQDRDIEAEDFDAVGYLTDLLLAVAPGVGGIRLKLVDPTINDL